MLCAIIAAANEETTIESVLVQTRRAEIERCVVVVNGSDDDTFARAATAAARLFSDFRILHYAHSCGPDIPHAIGLVEAQRQWSDTDWFVLLDGDLGGAFGPALSDFTESTRETAAKAVWIQQTSNLSRPDQELWRHVLAQTCPSLTYAEPAQVPRMMHISVLAQLPRQALLHPGFWLAHCVQGGVDCAAVVFDGRILGNKARSRRHQERMQETLIGDALEGTRLLLKKKPHRIWHGKAYLGYHRERRFDLLLQAGQSFQILV